MSETKTTYELKEAEDFLHKSLADVFDFMANTTDTKNIPDFSITIMGRTILIPNNADNYEILCSAAVECYEEAVRMGDIKPEPEVEECEHCGCCNEAPEQPGDFSQEEIQKLKTGDEFMGMRVVHAEHGVHHSQVVLTVK